VGSASSSPGSATASAEAEVVELASELIRIDTTNTGDPDTVVGEREAAEYVAAKLAEVGYEPTLVESGAPNRCNVFARLPSADRDRGALLMHGHLDVVPADPGEWAVHPFSGAVQDGYLWGRGAVDMKDMLAMTLAVARRFKRDGVVPPRDIVFAFLADEEAGGAYGSQWLVDNRADLFQGCSEAVGEVGGFSVTLGEDIRIYPLETAEKSIAWMRLRVRGTAGHGSMVHDDNAVTRLAEAVARLGRHRFPVVLTDTVETGAVTVCFPQDVQAQAHDWPVEFFAERTWHVARPLPERAAVARAAEVIRSARRPLVVAGGGVHYSFWAGCLAGLKYWQ